MLALIKLVLWRVTWFVFIIVTRWLIKAIFPRRTLRSASDPTRSGRS